jgi:hypothetical protein
MTAKEISKANDLTINQVRGRINKLELKRINKDKKEARYSIKDIELILKFKYRITKGKISCPIKISDKKKILIIEYYLKHQKLSIEILAETLLTNKFKISRIIAEFLEDGKCLTIQSKL